MHLPNIRERAIRAVAVGFVGLVLGASLSAAGAAEEAGPATQPGGAETETVVFLRHGEKPAGGLGQISPQGLNRAIALSRVLPAMFGKPDYLMAPDPGQPVSDAGVRYNYVRPLATIEPTAIALGMPVETDFGYQQIGKLNAELVKPKYWHAMIFVAWEHGAEAAAARDLLKMFGSKDAVPNWHGSDFDSLYVVKIRRQDGRAVATFRHLQEGLNGESRMMPGAATRS